VPVPDLTLPFRDIILPVRSALIASRVTGERLVRLDLLALHGDGG